MIKYELKNKTILKDGHTMFLQDVVKDLNRKANLEAMKERIEKLIAKYNDKIERLNMECSAIDGLLSESIENNNELNVKLFFDEQKILVSHVRELRAFISDLESLLDHI